MIVSKKKKTSVQLVKWVKSKVKCLYWYGTFGQKANKDLYKSKKKHYPLQYQWDFEKSMDGKQCFDCVGLIKGFLWDQEGKIVYNSSQDVSANGLRDLCKKHGKIKTIPEIPGVLVFLPGHVGVYIGGGYVIEARGHKYGVVKTKLNDRPWTSWGLCPWIDYIPVSKPGEDFKYYPKYYANTLSIVDALKALNIDSSKKHRKEIALANGFKSYSGTPKQNEKLLVLLKKGKLKRE